MWIILFFLALTASALEPFERLKNVKILKTFKGNIVQIDRGIEDGILRNDHIKLVNDSEGFASRALCIKTNATTSHWKLYRLPHAEAFSKDYTYTIIGSADSEIPENIQKLRETTVEIPALPKIEKLDTPDPFEISRDLPEKLTERDLIKTPDHEKKKLFVEEIFDSTRMKRELSTYHFSLYASPFTRQSINDGESLRYGFRGSNPASKYRLLTQFEKQQTKLKDPVTQESVATSSTNAQVQFIIHRLTETTSSLSLVNYQSTRFSSIGTPKSHLQVGPVGFTWHLFESKNWEYVDLSYVPLYDIRETEIIDPTGNVERVKTNGLRHGLRLGMKTQINERVAFENLLWVRPFQDLSTWRIEGDNLNLVNDLKIIFNLSGNFFFDYNLVYQKDKLWKTLNNLSETNIINSLNFRYDFDL
jgi:hypothetical protein